MSGRECSENPPALSSSSGNGCVLQLGSFNTYVSGPSTSKLAILLVSDVYGYEAPNLRKLADKVAAAGYYVVVPDFFYGDPYTMEKTLSIWIQSHGTAKGFEDAKQVVAALKDKGISAIGAAGFCWGAKVVTELSKSDYIQAVVLLHPSLVKVDDFKEVKVPIAILAAEIDKISPPELIKQFEEILSSKPEVDKFVKIFPGVKHGWTVRYNVENKEAVQHAEEAHRDMLDWLTKYVNENRDSVDGKEQVKVIYHDNNSMNSTRAEAYKCKDISGASSPSGKLKCCIPSESKSVAFQCQKYN